MDWQTIEGNWSQFTGKLKEKWGNFTDGDMLVINGKREQRIGKLQEKYGLAKEQAEKEADEFAQSLQ